jgi:hypothetical protein
MASVCECLQVNMSATKCSPQVLISFCFIPTFKVLSVFDINLINIAEDWLFHFNSTRKGRPVLGIVTLVPLPLSMVSLFPSDTLLLIKS